MKSKVNILNMMKPNDYADNVKPTVINVPKAVEQDKRVDMKEVFGVSKKKKSVLTSKKKFN